MPKKKAIAMPDPERPFRSYSLEALLEERLEDRTFPELVALNTELAIRRDELKERQREVNRLMDGLAVQREVLAKWDELDDDHKRAMRQVIGFS